MSHDLVSSFYHSFASGDGDAMATCYADEVVFEDPAFGELRGSDAGDMWRMLCSNASDLKVEHTVEHADDVSAQVHWIATYTFSATGRPVRNDIMATMRISDGKIVDHRDQFSFWKWSSQALGVPGKLLGWAPPFQKKVRSTALGNLAKFQARGSG